jgi:hypothetical protein
MDYLNNGVLMRVARSQIFSNPIRALAGLIKCKCCDATIMQVSARDGGYYGCNNAKGKFCDNKQQLSKAQVVAIILNDLKEKFLTTKNLKSMSALKGLLRELELDIIPRKHSSASVQPNLTSLYYVSHTSIQTVALLDSEY